MPEFFHYDESPTHINGLMWVGDSSILENPGGQQFQWMDKLFLLKLWDSSFEQQKLGPTQLQATI